MPLAMLAVVAVAMVLVGYVAQNTAANTLHDISTTRMQEEVSLVQQRLSEAEARLLFDAKLLARTPSLDRAMAAGDEIAIETMLILNLLEFDVNDLVAANSTGEVLSPIRDRQLIDLPATYDPAWIDFGLMGIEATGVVVEDEPVMVAVVPVYSATRQVVGALRVGRRLDDEFLGQINLERQEVQLALLRGGDLTAYYDGDTSAPAAERFGFDLDSAAVQQAAIGETVIADDFLRTADDVPFAVGYTTFTVGEEREGAVAVLLNLEELDELQSTAIRRQLLVLVALGLGASGALALLALVAVSRPLARLEHVAAQLTAGDYSQRVDVTTKDEVGQLGNAFNQMAEAVEQRDRDVREHARQAEIATKRAREAARIKSEFLANMSHELRTPLNAILGYTGIMLQGMGGEIDDDAEHMLERVESNAERLLGLINDVLDISKIEAGRLDMVNRPFEPRKLAAAWHAQMGVLAEPNGLDFEVTVDEAVPTRLVGDEGRITQVVTNLLSNAFKFTEEGKVSLQLTWEAGEWVIMVKDTGVGIPPHAHDLIFEEFRQLDGSSRRVYGGSGLGLTIVRNLCRMMDGRVSVESTLGQGSTFVVRLPLPLADELEAQHA